MVKKHLSVASGLSTLLFFLVVGGDAITIALYLCVVTTVLALSSSHRHVTVVMSLLHIYRRHRHPHSWTKPGRDNCLFF
jgi:hypothetical protein